MAKKASVFLDELKTYTPEMAELSIASFEKATVDTDFIRLDKETFGKIKGDSIDYAVMEKTSKSREVLMLVGMTLVPGAPSTTSARKTKIRM